MIQNNRLNFKQLSEKFFFGQTILLLSLLPSVLYAQKNKTWIKNPQMPLKEFQAHIKALGPSHRSYAHQLLIQKKEQAKAFGLKDKLLKAQEFYLSGEGDKAEKAFQQISRLAPSADWDEEDRRIILYSFLRLAQSEQDSEKRKALLLSTIDFALFQNEIVNYPDHHLFPPPLMKELKALQEKSNSLLVDWTAIFPDHEIILINGKMINKKEKTKIPSAFYRISSFSSSHQDWSKNIKLSELLTQKIKTKSLTKGPCEKLQISPHWQEGNREILPFSNCPKTAVLSFENNKVHPVKNNRSEPFAQSGDSFSFNTESLIPEEKASSLKKQSLLSDIPPWLILGAGVIVISILISLDQDEKKPKTGDYIL